MDKHVHGSMDIKRHEHDFVAFVKIAFWVCAASVAILLFLAVFNS